MRLADEELNLNAPALRRRLNALRETLRVQLDLAGLEARDACRAIDHEAERLVNQIPAADEATLQDIAARLRDLSERLRRTTEVRS